MKLLKGKARAIVDYFDSKQEKPTFETYMQTRSIIEVLFISDLKNRKGFTINPEFVTKHDDGLSQYKSAPYLVQIVEQDELQIIEIDTNAQDFNHNEFPFVAKMPESSEFKKFQQARRDYIRQREYYRILLG